MAIVIGISAGINTTKVAGINDNGTVAAPIRVRAADPVISLYGTFGRYLRDNRISLGEIEQVMLTGVGAAYVDDSVYRLPAAKTEELIYDGLGAQFETKLDDMIVVSMDTGASLVQCLDGDIRHIGGMGLEGGALIGLSHIMPKTDNIRQISILAMQNEGSDIDVRIGDINPNPLPNLPKTVAASLPGNAKSNTSREDIALGIIAMVLQTIGSNTILTSLDTGVKGYILIGNFMLLPQCKPILGGMEKLYGMNSIIPKCSEFCTVIGVALYFIDKKRKQAIGLTRCRIGNRAYSWM